MRQTRNQQSPLRVVGIIAGALLITMGAIALFTGEFDGAGIWIAAVGLAAVGVAGLIHSVTAAVSDA